MRLVYLEAVLIVLLIYLLLAGAGS
jgi:hypothetical protein